MSIRISALLAVALAAEVVQVQAQIVSGGPLGDLYLEREGGLVHYSSTDTTGGNDDRRRIAPGKTLALVDHVGAGWMLPIRFKGIDRQMIMRAMR